MGARHSEGVAIIARIRCDLAVTSVLLSGLSASLGYRKVLPPIVAGLAPMAVFAMIAAYFGLRVRSMFTRA